MVGVEPRFFKEKGLQYCTRLGDRRQLCPKILVNNKPLFAGERLGASEKQCLHFANSSHGCINLLWIACRREIDPRNKFEIGRKARQVSRKKLNPGWIEARYIFEDGLQDIDVGWSASAANKVAMSPDRLGFGYGLNDTIITDLDINHRLGPCAYRQRSRKQTHSKKLKIKISKHGLLLVVQHNPLLMANKPIAANDDVKRSDRAR